TNIHVGSNGICYIAGTLNLENPASFNTLTVDDSADGGQRVISLSTVVGNPSDSEGNTDDLWGRISGILGTINFEYIDTRSLTLHTGTNDSNVVNVLATNPYWGPTNIVSNSLTTVNVGDVAGVQNIATTLNLENPLSYDSIFVDDVADTSTRTVTLQT